VSTIQPNPTYIIYGYTERCADTLLRSLRRHFIVPEMLPTNLPAATTKEVVGNEGLPELKFWLKVPAVKFGLDVYRPKFTREFHAYAEIGFAVDANDNRLAVVKQRDTTQPLPPQHTLTGLPVLQLTAKSEA
jgi:hypothetical protein